MALWCDATRTITLNVMKQPTWQSGVMQPTLHITCEETTHMAHWCDVTHTTTIPVKKQPHWHSATELETNQHLSMKTCILHRGSTQREEGEKEM